MLAFAIVLVLGANPDFWLNDAEFDSRHTQLRDYYRQIGEEQDNLITRLNQIAKENYRDATAKSQKAVDRARDYITTRLFELNKRRATYRMRALVTPAAYATLIVQRPPRGPVLKDKTEKEKVERIFGTIEDPDQDCQFVMVGDKLSLTMKGGKQYDYRQDLRNCPRVVREVKGDFVVTVRVYAVLPDNAVPVKGEMAEAGAGLIILGQEAKLLRTGMHDFRGEKRHLMQILPNSRGPAGFPINAAGEGAFMRFSRKGDVLTLSVSENGKVWKTKATLSKMVLAETVRVGVYGFSNSIDDTTVSLDKFSLEPLKGGVLPKEGNSGSSHLPPIVSNCPPALAFAIRLVFNAHPDAWLANDVLDSRHTQLGGYHDEIVRWRDQIKTLQDQLAVATDVDARKLRFMLIENYTARMEDRIGKLEAGRGRFRMEALAAPQQFAWRNKKPSPPRP